MSALTATHKATRFYRGEPVTYLGDGTWAHLDRQGRVVAYGSAFAVQRSIDVDIAGRER